MIILINGLPQGPNGLIVPNGSISFSLNVDGTVIAAPGGFVSGSIEVIFQFNASGQIQPNSGATAQIYSNAELNPQNSTGLGTYYLVTFYDANGARINKVPMWWQFPESTGATVDISKMTPISTIGGNVIFYPTNFGGNGTVTSVAFVGDGTVLSATPSTPVTTSGDIAATLLTQNANTVLAGPTIGSAAAPTFRALVTADFPAGINVWSSLTAPIADLTLATTTFNTTFTSTVATTWKWSNITASTAILDQPSPALELANHFWSGSDQTNTFKIQASSGFLKFSSAASTFNQTFPYQFDSSVQINGIVQSVFAQFAFQTGNAGEVYAVSAAGNASAGLTTYSATVGIGSQPAPGQNITITGFIAHVSNNGTFVVHDATLTTITVYNAVGVAETQSAIATLDLDYHGLGGFSINVPNPATPAFPILGVVYGMVLQLNQYPNNPAMVSTVKGDATDAAYWRIINDGVTGNHGLEIGGIIDGTGAAPVILQLGHFNGISSAALNVPLTIPDTATAGGTITHATRVVTISAAHLNNLFSAPIQVLPAPGANLTYLINSVLAHYRFNTTGFTLNSATTLGLSFTPVTTDLVWVSAFLAGFCDTTPTTDVYVQAGTNSQNILAAAQVNQAVYVLNDVANMSGGDGTITLTIDYSIVNVSQLGTAV